MSNSQIDDSRANNDQKNAKSSNYNVKKSFISIVAAVLCGAGILMVIQYVFIVAILIIGNLLITVNPDTGEKINGPESIIPSIMGEWKSFLIFVIGIVCIYISRKALKSNNTITHKKSRAKIVTIEEEKATINESANSNPRK